MTRAQYNAFAWVHATGRKPKNIHISTRRFLQKHTWHDTSYDRVSDWHWKANTHLNFFDAIKKHPMIIQLRAAQQQGWRLLRYNVDSRRHDNVPSSGLQLRRSGLESAYILRGGGACIADDSNGRWVGRTVDFTAFTGDD